LQLSLWTKENNKLIGGRERERENVREGCGQRGGRKKGLAIVGDIYT
jgi:hypothetical protein